MSQDMEKVLKEENPKLWETLFKKTYRVVRKAVHRLSLLSEKCSHLTQEAKADALSSVTTQVSQNPMKNCIPQPGPLTVIGR